MVKTLVGKGTYPERNLRLASVRSTQWEEAMLKKKSKDAPPYKNGLADLGAYYGYVTEVTSVQPDFIVSFSK